MSKGRCHSNHFGTKIAINWLCVDDSDKAIGYAVGLSGRRQNADIADSLHLRDIAMATTFCLSVGYNFCLLYTSPSPRD